MLQEWVWKENQGCLPTGITEAVVIREASIPHHFPAKADLAIAVVAPSRELFDAAVKAMRASGAEPLTQPRAR